MSAQLPDTDIQFDVEHIRSQFPVLHQQVHGKPLIYFDNAATTQKPKQVIDAITEYYAGYNANIHRGIHHLAEKATAAFENTREAARAFLHAKNIEEIIFTSGTTDSINLVAHSYGKSFINEGDEIIISGMEHHSNIVPWQMLCEETGAVLKVIPVNENGTLDLDAFSSLLNERTQMVAVVYASNALGTINPVKKIIEKAHEVDAVVLIDGAQSSAHLQVNVQELDCDFYAMSAHKVYGPTGTGVLYGKLALLEKMSPYRGGGEMIKEVHFDKTTYNDPPYKFEAGTPNIADAIAFREALSFMNELNKKGLQEHEENLLEYSTDALSSIKGVSLVGTAEEKVSINSFTVKGVHHFDLGNMLDAKGIAVRTGHHCTQPLMERYGIEGTVRASYALYNTKEEIEAFAVGLEQVIKLLKG